MYDLGFDYGAKYPGFIKAVTADDINRVARLYLDTENYTLTIAGPMEEL